MISLLGIYRPGTTPLHKASAGLKSLMLLLTVIVTMMVDDPVTSVGIMCACLLLLVSTAPPAKATLRAMGIIMVVAVLTVSFQLWRGEVERAIDVAADLTAIAALALAISCSTPMESMLDLVSRMVRPFGRILPPETIGLMFALTLRAIPEAARIFIDARTAARARGLERDPRAVLIPGATRTVGFALQLGQALHARGIAEEAKPERTEKKPRRDRRSEKAAAKEHAAAQATADAETSETPLVTYSTTKPANDVAGPTTAPEGNTSAS
ncbi:energy-coupling factor transporter transmembrane component T family protein [Demequina oxidasica]|uniref:energy-coupling factor transporter transmembrane component T family protein n=1 Tax=Demequina oxidasica TaxID=676199 RepID=UPI000785E659|nr:energy-coupling factor transporter transmembrane protein EcfT [Demequina oxidasica]